MSRAPDAAPGEELPVETEYVTLHGELKLPCPEGFHVMDEAERARLHFLEKGEGVCLSDPERHMLVSAAWTRFTGLSALLLRGGDVARKNEADVRKALQGLGYRSGGFLQRSVGGTLADGFCYAYTAQDIPMYGESFALKSVKTLYYFHLYAREALKEESLPVWEALLSGAEWM